MSSMSSMSKSRSKKLKTSFTASAQTPLASASSSKGVVAPSSSATGTALLKISELERRLTSSGSQGADLNPLVDLLDYVRQPGTSSKVLKVRTAAAHALHNAFSSLVRQGRLLGKIKDGSNGAQEKEAAASALKAVREWAKARWNDYLENLCGLLCTSEPEEETLSITALNILMSLLRTTSEHLSALQTPVAYAFDGIFWRRILAALVGYQQQDGRGPTPAVQAEFVNRYLNYMDDIRFYFLRGVAEIVQSDRASDACRKSFLFYLEHLTTMPTAEEDINAFWAGQPKSRTGKAGKAKASKLNKKRKRATADSGDGSTGIFDDSDESAVSSGEEEAANARLAITERKVGQHELHSLTAHRKAFTQAWTMFLGLHLGEDEIKQVLVMLHRQVMPHLLDPSILIDFLADCTDYGGTVALLALNGLYTLVTKHRLDYPNFFLNLYRLLDNQVLHVRYRPRFLRMLDTFLLSPKLPIALVASFIKRLARLCLSAPPAAIVSVMPFIYNLLKRHPGCMVLIHSEEQVEPGQTYQDPYLDGEADPLQTRAIDSSLWEVATLKNHYLASVSTLAKIFGEAFTKPNYAMEDFLDHAYSTLFETESGRKIKRAPAMNAPVSTAHLEYIFPGPAADDQDADEAALALEGKGDIVTKLWRFS